MQILITGRHVGVTEAMKSYARDKVAKLERFFDRATSARVTMDIQHDTHLVEMQLDLVRGASAVGKAQAPDMYAALDLAEQKIAMQLRRFNERLKSHHRRDAKGEARVGAAAPADGVLEDVVTYEDVIEDLRRGALPNGAVGATDPSRGASRPPDVPDGGHER